MRWRSLIAVVLIGASGCGLSEYEKRMDAQRARINQFDAFNHMLDDPIETPTGSTEEKKPAWPFDIFLRLPKGFTTKVKDTKPYYTDFSFFRYSNGAAGTSIFVVAAWIAEPKAEQEFGKYQTDNFRRYIRNAIEDFYGKTYKSKPFFSEVKPSKREVPVFTPYPDGAPKIAYVYLMVTDAGNKLIPNPTAFDVYLHEQAGKQVGIVVQRPYRQPGADAFNRSIELCLGTLDASNEAAGRRAGFKKAKGP